MFSAHVALTCSIELSIVWVGGRQRYGFRMLQNEAQWRRNGCRQFTIPIHNIVVLFVCLKLIVNAMVCAIEMKAQFKLSVFFYLPQCPERNERHTALWNVYVTTSMYYECERNKHQMDFLCHSRWKYERNAFSQLAVMRFFVRIIYQSNCFLVPFFCSSQKFCAQNERVYLFVKSCVPGKWVNVSLENDTGRWWYRKVYYKFLNWN